MSFSSVANSSSIGSLMPSTTSSPRVNCSVAEELKPNPDISGIGVKHLHVLRLWICLLMAILGPSRLRNLSIPYAMLLRYLFLH